jgi:hypothetical protein
MYSKRKRKGNAKVSDSGVPAPSKKKGMRKVLKPPHWDQKDWAKLIEIVYWSKQLILPEMPISAQEILQQLKSLEKVMSKLLRENNG